MQRIGTAHVCRQAVIVEIEFFGFFIKDHVFDDGAEFLGCGIDFRFGFGAQVDGLGIAAAFKVEGAAYRTSHVRHRRSVCGGICGQCGFAGAGQAKEHAVSTGLPMAWLAEQCIGITPFSGSK